MADTFDSTGLTVSTSSEIRTQLEDDLKLIYGTDINIDQNSPDGQLIGIITQVATDLRELLVSINSGFDPDQAIGITQDQRVAINSITRAGGSYTTQPIDIVVDATVDLDGLDADFNNPDGVGFTIQDGSGNEFILIDSVTLTAGSHTKNFRAKNIGLVETTVGTITNFVTIILGVVSVNNSSGALEVGADEETDAELRLRRQKSVAISSQGYLNGIEAAFLDLDGVTDAKVYENVTNAVDADGIPAHGMWAIVEGGANTDIANVIYTKKSAGCDMLGAVTLNTTTATGATFTSKFDRPSAENLHIQFDIQKTISTATFDQAAIKADMVANLVYKIGEFSETSSVTAQALASIAASGGGGVPVNMEISLDGITWFDYLETTTKDNQFTLDVTRITITELP